VFRVFSQPMPDLIVDEKSCREGEDLRRNTYAMIEGCPALKNHLDVKRVLIEDEAMREEYAAVKRELAKREYEKMGEYSGAKSEILCKILRGAGWTKKEIEER
jgi:GrpB-like predicted nucleotidyltransferase (UPF0157 family)